MKEYLEMVQYILDHGVRKVNRTGVATLSCFAYFYKISLKDGYPLLTTKRMNFDSILHELFWYLSGEEHLRHLHPYTRIWDAWADREGKLETAYGRFWRRFPVPEKGLPGEKWGTRWVSVDPQTGEKVFDQIQYVIDSLKEIRQNPQAASLRRLVISAWHPANAAESKLPPCHYTFCLSVSGNTLNCHLTQRSADVAIGLCYNLAAYSLLTMMMAKETGYEAGEFAHTIIDAHIYQNHIDGLKEQLEREPRPLPSITIADKPFNQLRCEDVQLEDYYPYSAIKFAVAV